jgi:hypothetical protein
VCEFNGQLVHVQVHVELPADANGDPGQPRQLEEAVELLYVPPAQSSHLLAPDVPENVPAPQFVHILAPVVTEYLSAGHTVHTMTPTTDEYVPMSQVHEVNATHPLHTAPEFVGHAWQDALPVVFLYLPDTHRVYSPVMLQPKPTL